MGKLVQALVVPWLCLWLATVLVPEVSSQECSEQNCGLQTFRCQDANKQCCKQYVGCPCDRQLYPGCDQFKNGLVPLGDSVYRDFGHTRCTCNCNLELQCEAIPCPEIPPGCKRTMQPADGCLQCVDP
ncbi:hypothetical protein NDU88_000346 [Pleurodeles waltl]|uniref:Uncharacterized protein n=1 Tax=Pleurodeles waltl TaxID=8319 RepID=A0AAV7NB35_PLEWA|nr:hypothetical protein NDU88_000346 [Pleurodeles waltl]